MRGVSVLDAVGIATKASLGLLGIAFESGDWFFDRDKFCKDEPAACVGMVDPHYDDESRNAGILYRRSVDHGFCFLPVIHSGYTKQPALSVERIRVG